MPIGICTFAINTNPGSWQATEWPARRVWASRVRCDGHPGYPDWIIHRHYKASEFRGITQVSAADCPEMPPRYRRDEKGPLSTRDSGPRRVGPAGFEPTTSCTPSSRLFDGKVATSGKQDKYASRVLHRLRVFGDKSDRFQTIPCTSLHAVPRVGEPEFVQDGRDRVVIQGLVGRSAPSPRIGSCPVGSAAPSPAVAGPPVRKLAGTAGTGPGLSPAGMVRRPSRRPRPGRGARSPTGVRSARPSSSTTCGRFAGWSPSTARRGVADLIGLLGG
jgi:hypothetical protein